MLHAEDPQMLGTAVQNLNNMVSLNSNIHNSIEIWLHNGMNLMKIVQNLVACVTSACDLCTSCL